MASATGRSTRARVPGGVPAGAKHCGRCRKVKPLAAFYFDPRKGRPYSRCRVCCVVAAAVSRDTDTYRAYRREYNRRPDQARWRREYEADPERRALRRRQAAARSRTPRYKVARRIKDLRRSLRRVDLTPERRAAWEAELALCAAVLARMDAAAGRRREVA
jgi:hypothetical protein